MLSLATRIQAAQSNGLQKGNPFDYGTRKIKLQVRLTTSRGCATIFLYASLLFIDAKYDVNYLFLKPGHGLMGNM